MAKFREGQRFLINDKGEIEFDSYPTDMHADIPLYFSSSWVIHGHIYPREKRLQIIDFSIPKIYSQYDDENDVFNHPSWEQEDRIRQQIEKNLNSHLKPALNTLLKNKSITPEWTVQNSLYNADSPNRHTKVKDIFNLIQPEEPEGANDDYEKNRDSMGKKIIDDYLAKKNSAKALYKNKDNDLGAWLGRYGENKFWDWLEAIDYNAGRTVIVKKGEVLYHGTIESFDTRGVTTSSYDDVFWTSDKIMVARTYIPVAGSYSNFSISHVLKPNDKESEQIRKSLGITKSVMDVAYKKDQEGYKLLRYWDDKNRELSDKWKEIQKLPDYDEYPGIDEFFDQWREAENNAIKYKNEWKPYDKYLKAFVAQKFKTLGYDVQHDYVRRVRLDSDGNILPADSRTVGKVLKVTCGRDFKIYNYAYGKESDLMDLDYHKIDMFRKMEEEGYDGIIINDFAQSDKYGNMDHKSVGFFKNSLKDLQIKQIRSQTHPRDEEY